MKRIMLFACLLCLLIYSNISQATAPRVRPDKYIDFPLTWHEVEAISITTDSKMAIKLDTTATEKFQRLTRDYIGYIIRVVTGKNNENLIVEALSHGEVQSGLIQTTIPMELSKQLNIIRALTPPEERGKIETRHSPNLCPSPSWNCPEGTKDVKPRVME